MSETVTVQGRPELSRLKLFLALSRTPHGVLDLAAPALGALLAAGRFPPLGVAGLGLATAFAGYTAVYALNDVIDHRVDRERLAAGAAAGPGDLDSVYVRHPLAQGLLSLREGLFWVAAWALLALIGAYRLNPLCAVVFLAAAALEAAYCLLLRVHPLRTLVSGVVKSSGAIAAVFAVDPAPSPALLLGLFAWLFLWEIGGQNVPNDWADLDEDCRLGARTVPVCLGPAGARAVILTCLLLSLAIGVLLFGLAPASLGLAAQAAALAAGLVLAVSPAWRLYRAGTRDHASALFNRASYYPLAVLVIVVLHLTFGAPGPS
ncbi:MAG: UbiA family prenyltransferase [Deltaproteobacteria bacterium]|nr:UbiA family prenyltransferase [Deltaproteobacteria bacterium]